MSSSDFINEQDAYRFIQAAYVANRIDFQIDMARLARTGSPVYSPKMALFPMLFLMLLCMIALIAALLGYISLMTCIGAMIAALLAQVFLVRFWIVYRVQRRTMTALLTHLSYWKSLWRFGGVAISLSKSPSTRCTAPSGDWRSFVMAHLADMGQPAFRDDGNISDKESEMNHASGT